MREVLCTIGFGSDGVVDVGFPQPYRWLSSESAPLLHHHVVSRSDGGLNEMTLFVASAHAVGFKHCLGDGPLASGQIRLLFDTSWKESTVLARECGKEERGGRIGGVEGCQFGRLRAQASRYQPSS